MATLIIGIGTSGLGVLEAAQQFNYEFTGQNTPDDLEYVFIDTEKASTPKPTPLGKTSIHKIPIPLDGVEGSVARLRANEDFDDSWFPSKIKVEADSGAAGGRPTYGRLGLWVYYDKIDSYLNAFAAKSGNKRIVVVGSLTGGTGSGICVDLAYLIRHRINNVDLQAVFMVPSESDYSMSNKVIYENAFQALRSLEYYSIPANIYKMTTPNGIDIEMAKAPYDLVSVLSQDYDANNGAVIASKMTDLSELIRSVGLYICSMFLEEDSGDFKGRIEERRNDAVSVNNHMKHFSSFGISLAQYPKRMLEEYVALDYSKEIINYWKNAEVKNNTIENIARNNIEKHIIDSIENKLNIVVNNKNLDQYTKFVVQQIIEKRYETHEDLDSYLADLFKETGVIYASINKSIKEARDSIILKINQDLNSLTKDPKIKALKEYLKGVSSHLDTNNKKGMLYFWNKNYSINGDPKKWPAIYDHFMTILKNSRQGAKMFFQDNEYLEERLNDIIQLLKMNLLYPEIENIGKAIVDKDFELFAEGKRLINLNDTQNIENALDRIIDPAASISFTGRQSYIEANNASYAQVYYYYKKGKFEAEVADIKKKIDGVEPIDISGKDILEDNSLFKFLTNEENPTPKDSKELYFSILPKVINRIAGCLRGVSESNSDIYTLISNQKKENPIMKFLAADPLDLKQSPPAFMAHANPQGTHGLFASSPCLKLIYASEDIGKVEMIANKLREKNGLSKITITDAPPSPNATKLSALKDSIVIFREYSYYGGKGDVLDCTLIPTRDIRSITIIKDEMLESIEDLDFVNNRLPYFNQLVQNNNFNIKQEITKTASHDTLK